MGDTREIVDRRGPGRVVVGNRRGRSAAAVGLVVGLVAALIAGVTPPASAQEPTVLMVTQSATGSVDDQKIAAALTAGGFAVTTIDDDLAAADGDGVAGGFDAVLITATAGPGKVGSTFTTTQVPVVSYEFLLYDDLGLTLNGSADRGEQGSFRTMDIADAAHPIADGLPAGETTVFTTQTKVTWGKPAAAADIIATQTGDPTRATIFAYEAGALLANGLPAPARRAGLFPSPGSDGALSTVGDQLLVAALTWAVQGGTTGGNRPPTVDAGADVTVESTDPVDVTLQGTVTDDGLPEGSSITTVWSGPASVSFSSPASLATTATFPGPGVYPVSLTADDGERSGSDTLLVTVSDPNGPPEILMVAQNPSGTTDDRTVANLLRGAGYAVTIADDDQVQASGDSVAAGFDAVLITATASASKVGPRFADTALPVVTYKHALYDDMALTASGSANRGEQGSYVDIDIVDPTHPIVAGAFAGRTQVYTGSTKVSYGRPGPEADVVARRVNSADRATIFAYEPGAVLVDGTPAPARRVGLFPTTASDGLLNDAGRTLVVNTLAWVLGAPAEARNRPPTVDAGSDVVVSSVDPVTVVVTGQVSDDGLPEGGSVSSLWTGPGEVAIAVPTALSTPVDLPGPGSYTLTLVADDTERTGSDTVTITVVDPSGPAGILLVTSSATGGADDQEIKSVLEAVGFAVTVADDNTVTAAQAVAFDAVIITANASPSVIGSTLTSLPVPIITYEYLLHDDLKLTAGGSGNRGEQGTFRGIDVVRPDHPIANGLSGETDVFTRFLKVSWGKPAASADVIATQLRDGSRATIFAYDTGDPLVDATPAPAPRVGLFPAANSDGELNATGRTLLVNAVGWVLPGANSAPVVDAGPDQVVDAGAVTELAGSFTDDPLPIGSTPVVSWTGQAGVTFSDPSSLTSSVTFAAAGVYTLTLTVDDGLDSGSDTVDITAVAQQPPTAAGTVDRTSGSSPLTVNVDGSASSDPDGTVVSYRWDFGDGRTATGATASHTYVSAGTFDITLTVVDDFGAADTTVIDTVSVISPEGDWADPSRSYRTEIVVAAGSVDRIDRPALVPVDFGALLSGLGASDPVNPASLRLIELDARGAVADGAVPVQFVPDGPGSDTGTLLVQLNGTLPAGQTRRFQLYFELVGGTFQAAPFAPLVVVDPNATDEGDPSFAIQTSTGTYRFDTEGGGFSSLDDVDGNDWINHSDAARGLGEFRGFPNMIHPETQFHPAGTGVTTTLVESGPIRVAFDVSVGNGAWQGRWEIYPTFARFELTAAAKEYWFLYEGTPGGTFEPTTDLYVRSDGTSVTADTAVGTDIPGVEWAMAGDPVANRSFFVAHDQDDNLADAYFNFNDQMTVLSIGRGPTGVEKLMTSVPAVFTVGLIDTVLAAEAAAPIDSARLDLSGSAAPAEVRPSGETGEVSFVPILAAG